MALHRRTVESPIPMPQFPRSDRPIAPVIPLRRGQEYKPLRDSRTHTFYSIFNAISTQKKLDLVATFPNANEGISRLAIVKILYPKDQARDMLTSTSRTIEGKSFSDFIEKGTDNNQLTYRLTSKGRILKEVAVLAKKFFRDSQLTPDALFGKDKSNDITSTIVRCETLFEIAISKENGLRQTQLISLLETARSTPTQTFAALLAANLITVDQNHAAHLTDLGKIVIQDLLLPIAKLTGYPAERIAEIEAALTPQKEPAHPAETTRKQQQTTNTSEDESQYEIYRFIPLSVDEERALVMHIQHETDMRKLQEWVNSSPVFSNIARKSITTATQEEIDKPTTNVIINLYYPFIITGLKKRYAEKAEDIAHTLIAKNMRSIIQRYDSKKKFRHYLIRCITNLLIDNIRRETKARHLFTTLPPYASDRWQDIEKRRGLEENPEEEVIRREQQYAIQHAMDLAFWNDKLKEKYRTPIVLRYWYDMGYEEIAAALHIPPRLAKARLYRGRQILKQVFKQQEIVD